MWYTKGKEKEKTIMSKLQSVFLKLKSLKKRTYIIIGGCIFAGSCSRFVHRNFFSSTL